MNETELKQLIKIKTRKRAKGSSEELEETQNNPNKIQESPLMQSRELLENFLNKNWENFSTNMPCLGQQNNGKCTIFNCSELLHIHCYLSAQKFIEKEQHAINRNK